MNDVNVALIGCGNLGQVHARCLSEIPKAQCVAYVDVNEGAARGALDTFGGRYATDDAGQVWRDDAIDAVYICTRHDSHASLAIAAAEAGKHVLMEKPLALTLGECEAVAEAVERTGVWLMPAFKMRFCPLVREARTFLPQPQVLVGQMMDHPWPDDKWVQDPVQGGANVASQGCHTTDLLRFLAGSEPEAVWAAGGAMSHPGHPCIDQCVATIRFTNGCVASWIQGDAAIAPFTSKFFFGAFGHARSVQLHDRLTQATFHDGRDTWTRQRPDEEGFLLENQAFIEALAAGRAPELDVHDAVAATRLVLAAERAIRTGQVQQLPAASPDTRSPAAQT